jgi:putative membrane protein
MKDAPKDPDTKTKWAEDRTDWAEDRTVMANERTFAGWMRTALAAVAVAIGLKAVFGEFQPTWAARTVASVFIAGAVFIVWSAHGAARSTTRRMDDHAVQSQDTRAMTIIAVVLTLGSLATAAILWML